MLSPGRIISGLCAWQTRKPLLTVVLAQAFIGSLPLWYYSVRIGMIGMACSRFEWTMRCFDVVLFAALVASAFMFARHAGRVGDRYAVRLFRIAMWLCLFLTIGLAIAVMITFVFVPYVPASFPPATPATWISLTLALAAPLVAAAVGLSFTVAVSSIRWKL